MVREVFSSFIGEKDSSWSFSFYSHPLLILIFLIFPTTFTLRVKHINPIGYYIHSIDGSKIPANQPIRIEFDFRILKGSPEKPGYVNLFGERTDSSPIYLKPDKAGSGDRLQKRGYLFLFDSLCGGSSN